jgi:hypothetical protein
MPHIYSNLPARVRDPQWMRRKARDDLPYIEMDYVGVFLDGSFSKV